MMKFIGFAAVVAAEEKQFYSKDFVYSPQIVNQGCSATMLRYNNFKSL